MNSTNNAINFNEKLYERVKAVYDRRESLDLGEQEARLLLGAIQGGRRVAADLIISVHANRVPVLDGHTVCLSLGFGRPPAVEQAIEVLREFRKHSKILVALDGSDHAKKALETAVKLAGRCEAELILFHAMQLGNLSPGYAAMVSRGARVRPASRIEYP